MVSLFDRDDGGIVDEAESAPESAVVCLGDGWFGVCVRGNDCRVNEVRLVGVFAVDGDRFAGCELFEDGLVDVACGEFGEEEDAVGVVSPECVGAGCSVAAVCVDEAVGGAVAPVGAEDALEGAPFYGFAVGSCADADVYEVAEVVGGCAPDGCPPEVPEVGDVVVGVCLLLEVRPVRFGALLFGVVVEDDERFGSAVYCCEFVVEVPVDVVYEVAGVVVVGGLRCRLFECWSSVCHVVPVDDGVAGVECSGG